MSLPSFVRNCFRYLSWSSRLTCDHQKPANTAVNLPSKSSGKLKASSLAKLTLSGKPRDWASASISSLISVASTESADSATTSVQ
ncbi:hypothetical protein D3C81_2142050 [compost metagenome]